MDNKNFKLMIATPTRLLFDAEVRQVTMPTANGSAAVLVDHAAMVTGLDYGVIAVEVKPGEVIKISCFGGISHFKDNTIRMALDNGILGSEIDSDLAEKDLAVAKEGLAAASDPAEKEEATLKYKRAVACFDASR